MTKAIELADDIVTFWDQGFLERCDLQECAAELRRLAAVEQENDNLLAANKYTSDLLNQALQELADLKKLSVTNILLDVTPGDGSGFEVYAKSVKDVEDMLTKLGTELEDFQLGIKKPFEVEKKLQELADLKAAMGEPVAWHTEDHLTDRSATTYDKNMMYRWQCKGWPITPLYAKAKP